MEKLNVLNEISVVYTSKGSCKVISNSHSAAKLCREIFALDGCNIDLKEYFYIILLDNSNTVKGYYKLSEGGIDATIADVRIAFSVALKCLASGVILCHNHPSGKLAASDKDVLLTRKFKDAGRILSIKVLDHIILTQSCYSSIADSGLL